MGYGNSSNKPIVANYDPGYDCKADLAVQGPDGSWAIDFAADGYGTWNTPYYYGASGGVAGKLVPGHYTSPGGAPCGNPANGNLDQGFVVYDFWYLDRSYNGYATSSSGVDLTVNNAARQIVDGTKPYISQTVVTARPLAPAGCGDSICSFLETCYNCRVDCGQCPGNFWESAVSPSNLRIGVRYTANVYLEGGSQSFGHVNVAVHPDLRIPRALNMSNIGGTVNMSTATVQYPHSRKNSFTCSEWGVFPIAFSLNTGPAPDEPVYLNPDNGVMVSCTSEYPGIYGYVRDKRTGQPISGATVAIAGQTTQITTSSGLYKFLALTGGPYKVTISASAHSQAIAVNVRVPGFPVGYAGVQVDAELEESFNLGAGSALTYKTYIDYSRGRSVLHTVEATVTQVPATVGKAGVDANCLPDQFGCGGCWDENKDLGAALLERRSRVVKPPSAGVGTHSVRYDYA